MGRWTYRQPEGKRAYSDMIVRSLECVSVFKLLWPIALSDLSRILCRLRFWTTVHWKRIITKGNTLHRLTVWLYMQREVAFYQGHTEAAQLFRFFSSEPYADQADGLGPCLLWIQSWVHIYELWQWHNKANKTKTKLRNNYRLLCLSQKQKETGKKYLLTWKC